MHLVDVRAKILALKTLTLGTEYMPTNARKRDLALIIQNIAHNQDEERSSFDFARVLNSKTIPLLRVEVLGQSIRFHSFKENGEPFPTTTHNFETNAWKGSVIATQVQSQIDKLPQIAGYTASSTVVSVWSQIVASLEHSQSQYIKWLTDADYSQYVSSRNHLQNAIDRAVAAGFHFDPNMQWADHKYPEPPQFDPTQERLETRARIDEIIETQKQRFEELRTKEEEEQNERRSRMMSREESYNAAIAAAEAKSAELSAQIASVQNNISTLKGEIKGELRSDLVDDEEGLAKELERLEQNIATRQAQVEAAHAKYEQYVKRLGQATEEAGRDKLVKFFAEAKKNAACTGKAFFVCFLLAAAGVVYLLLGSIDQSSTLPWQGIVLRITGASMAVYFAIYSARQATRSRNIYTEYERLIAELSTIEAYLSTQDEEVIRMVKLLMLPEFFGRNAAKISPEELPDVDGANPLPTLNTTSKTIPKMVTTGGKGNPVTSIAAATLPALLKHLSNENKPPATPPTTTQPVVDQFRTDMTKFVQEQQSKDTAKQPAEPVDPQPDSGTETTSTQSPKNPKS